MSEPSRFTHWYENQTVVHPVGLVVLLGLAMLAIVLPRRHAALPILLLTSFVPVAQRVVVFGFDFNFLRVLILVCFARLWIRGETRPLRWTAVDLCFVAWMLAYVTIESLRVGTRAAVVHGFGTSFDAFAIFCFFRLLVKDFRGVAWLSESLMFASIPTAIFFLIELSSGRNLFSMLGGVPEFTEIREGRLRCQGAFVHPIIAGCFWVSVLPLIVARAWYPPFPKRLAALGATSVLAIVLACASSTPVLALAAVVAAALLYPVRFSLSWVRWGAITSVLALHLAMEKPVWHLLARVRVFGGSTGWHRYNVIDKFIANFHEWWLRGTNSTAHWGWMLDDTTNVYVAQGVHGGLATLGLFLLMIGVAFRQNGLVLRRYRRKRSESMMTWGLGLCLFAHTVMMIAVSYYGQILVTWYMTFGLIASIASMDRARSSAQTRSPSQNLTEKLAMSAR